jgi:predicted RNA-binding Zn ribbon-like protein
MQLDYYSTNTGRHYQSTDLRIQEEPESHSPEDVEAWLAETALLLVRTITVKCTCSCKNCSWMVVERGSSQNITHRVENGTCTCQRTTECCGIPLDPR